MTRAAAGAAVGALVASAALAVIAFSHPSVILDFDADLPRAVTSGFYPVEQNPNETFAWTTPLASITLRGIDRDAAWVCTARLRGARPAGAPQAETRFGVDGVTRVTHSPGAAYEDVAVEAPARPGASSLTLTISTAPAFVPGPSDTRELGVQVDRVACSPSASAWMLPARGALAAAAAAGAAFGSVFAVLSPTLAFSLLGSALLGAALAFIFSSGAAAYSRAYLEWTVPVALWITVPLLVFAGVRARLKRPMHPAAGFVLAFSSAVLFIKILTLLHPSKDVVDAVFHAHRLEWVLGGRYYFTQPMPGGVQFPYAIGLYVTAAPWAALVRDHVALLRIAVCVAEALAAALLYVAVSRAWGDRLAGAAAVVLYHLAPLPYVVIGNANLTYAFGQSVAVMAVVASATLKLERRRLPASAALFAITALAFLSHVGIFPILAVTLVGTGVLYWIVRDGALRSNGTAILLATVLAACFAVGSYYAHFPEVYRTLERVTGRAPESVERPAGNAAPPTVKGQPALTIGARAARAATLGVRGIGWPLLALAALGVWVVWTAPRDRLTLALGGWGISFVVFLAFRVLAPVDAQYQRYADEFIDRVYYATLPAVAILAGLAVAWGWRRNRVWRSAATLAFATAALIGIRQWIAWIQ